MVEIVGVTRHRKYRTLLGIVVACNSHIDKERAMVYILSTRAIIIHIKQNNIKHGER